MYKTNRLDLVKTQKCAGGGRPPLTIVFRLCYTKYIELVVGPAFSVLKGEKKEGHCLSAVSFWSEC